MNITFRQVDAFRAVVSAGTVTEAARLLGVSQPAVSRLIADLEHEVGFQLFRREGRTLAPTQEGRLLVAEVRQAVSGMEHIKDAARVIAGFGHAVLRLVTTPALAARPAPDLIADFSSQLPNVMTRLEIEANDDTVEWLVSQSHDFGLSTSVPASQALDYLVLYRGGVFCVLPEDHPHAGAARVSPADLSGESFVSYIAGSRFRQEIDRVFDAAGVSRRLQFETRTTEAIARLVARGLGVSVVAAMAEQVRDIRGCRTVPFDAALEFQAVLVWSAKRPMSAPAVAFLDLARSFGAQG